MIISKRTLWLAVLAAAPMFPTLPAARATITVIDYWRLGENDPGAAPGLTAPNTVDSANTNNLVFPVSPSYSAAVSGSAAASVGSSLCLNFSNLEFGGCGVISGAVDNFGLELWVNPANTSTACLAYNGNTSNNGWGLYQYGGNFAGLLGGRVIFQGGHITPGIWTHLALVRDSGTMTLYVNGSAAATTATTPGTPTTGFGLGAPPMNPTTEFFTGFLDEVRVFTFAPGQFSTNDLLLAQGAHSTTQPLVATNWHFANTGGMAVSRRLQSVFVLTNGLVFVAGGQSFDNPADVELYSLASGAWSETAPLTVSRLDPAMAMLADGRVLVASGEGILSGITNSCEIYNPATAAWTNTGPVNVGRMYGAANLLANGNVLMTGGTDPGFNITASAEIYSPATGVWTNTRSMAYTRYHHAMVALADGRVLVAGGDSQSGPSLNTAEIYNPLTGVWTNTAPMSAGRDYVTATLLTNGQVLVTGGGLANGDVYNPGSNTWTLTGPMSLGRLGNTATLLQNGQVLVTGGLQDNEDSYASTEIYNPVTSTWTNGPSMNVGRRYHAATLLPNGQILISGGDLGPTLTAAAELYVAPQSLPPQMAGIYSKVGSFQLSFTNNPAALFNVLASADLRQSITNWTVLGNAVEGPAGHFQWTDTNVTGGPSRFYRLRNQ